MTGRSKDRAALEQYYAVVRELDAAIERSRFPERLRLMLRRQQATDVLADTESYLGFVITREAECCRSVLGLPKEQNEAVALALLDIVERFKRASE